MEDESNTSAMLYNLALLSERVCGLGGAKKDAIDLSICSEAEETDKVTGSKAKQMTASLKRPTSELQMSRLFSMWSLVCHATGICTCLVLLAFLDEVVYKPVAEGLYTWEVAFEIVLQYLQEVEASNGMFCIGNIRQKLGGIDAVRCRPSRARRRLRSTARGKSTRVRIRVTLARCRVDGLGQKERLLFAPGAPT